MVLSTEDKILIKSLRQKNSYWTRNLIARPSKRGGVAGASAPGPGGPKGARRAHSKKI